MARHIVLGNQQLLVNIDKWLQVRDIYFPYVGQENHLLGHAHKIAVLEGDETTWINHDEWDKKISYLNETLVTNSSATRNGIVLLFNENVYCEANIFFRKITIKNETDHKRTIKICFVHDFHLNGDGIGDTAIYHPKHKAIIHYKKSIYFLIGITKEFDYNIGEKVTPAWNLPKNAIAQGEIDSIIGTTIILEPHSEHDFCYYLMAGENFDEVFSLQEQFLDKGAKAHIKHSQQCQRGWLGQIQPNLSILDERLQELYKRSLLIIKTQIDKRGAILAANDSDNMQFNKDTYSYMWPRDGALVAIALIKAGYPELAKEFFRFCNNNMYEEGCMLHKYNPDGTLGSSWHPWIHNNKFSLPIQEDETALVLHALWIYYQRTKDKKLLKEMYESMIKPMGTFLVNYKYENGLPKESYDLWEERRGIYTFTSATVLAGLRAAELISKEMHNKTICDLCNTNYKTIKTAMKKHLYNKKEKYFRRGVNFETGKPIYDEAIDASVYGLFEFDAFDVHDIEVKETMEKVKEWLWVKTPVGGIARYQNDYYFQKSKDIHNVPGNPWFICTLWYAKYLIKKAKTKEELQEALALINWVADHALETGVLAEQVHPYSGEPLSVSPLTWSHAEFVDTITNYIEKIETL